MQQPPHSNTGHGAPFQYGVPQQAPMLAPNGIMYQIDPFTGHPKPIVIPNNTVRTPPNTPILEGADVNALRQWLLPIWGTMYPLHSMVNGVFPGDLRMETLFKLMGTRRTDEYSIAELMIATLLLDAGGLSTDDSELQTQRAISVTTAMWSAIQDMVRSKDTPKLEKVIDLLVHKGGIVRATKYCFGPATGPVEKIQAAVVAHHLGAREAKDTYDTIVKNYTTEEDNFREWYIRYTSTDGESMDSTKGEHMLSAIRGIKYDYVEGMIRGYLLATNRLQSPTPSIGGDNN